MEITTSLKRRMLVQGIKKVARATGDSRGRYRSEGVSRTVGARIQRDHIWKKHTLAEKSLSGSTDLDSIIEQAHCCVVTVGEHGRLRAISADLDSWERYKATAALVTTCSMSHK